MANAGGTLGPDLTKIGAIRTRARFARGDRVSQRELCAQLRTGARENESCGDQFGILKSETPDEVVLATGPGAEVRLARADVLKVEPATISLMPPGFDGILTPQELADLVAFLRTAK